MTDGRFAACIDSLDESAWSTVLGRFSDANLYQTRAYGLVRWGKSRLSHLVLMSGDRPVAIAQLLIAASPRLRAGIAYLRGGPLWRLKGEPEDVDRLKRIAQALVAEYVERRRLFLRVLPNACAGTPHGAAFDQAFSGFRAESFRPGESFRTLVLDLNEPPDVLRKRLDQKWRNQLNRSEKNGLTVREGDSPEDFARYVLIHDDMLARKRFEGASNVREFERMQGILPPGQKMHVMTCEHDGRTVAGLVGTSLGDTGTYLLGATTTEGMHFKGAYLLQWRMIQRLRSLGVVRYDLNGINPETNPGVYHFKAGLGGDDRFYLSPRVLCDSIGSSLVARAERVARSSVRQRLMRHWCRE